MQPYLFPEYEQNADGDITIREEAGKKILQMLAGVRLKAAEFDRQKIFIHSITALMNDVRSKTRATPTQIEGMILYAIERNEAWTLTEISDDLKIDRAIIKTTVLEMQEKGLVEIIQKYVPGMFKKTYLIRSIRMNLPVGD